LTYETDVPINILITINDECGNSSTETVVVSMPSVPVFVNVPQGQTICQGETIELQGSGSGGLGQLEYEWIDVAESSSIEVTPEESSYVHSSSYRRVWKYQ
jgi:hypothetical protein